ncbi:hypothetical protein GGI20_002219 [Coemansia sp. BCRC 34301]|nr:hypothetical protein GGI20_002219 [Coemansia sp. BCRC 34301]
MGAVESLPSPSYHEHHSHNNHRLFGGDRHPSTASPGSKPVRSATICLSSCTFDPDDGSGDFPTGDEKSQTPPIKQAAATTRGLFRASLRRYSYRAPASWIHGKDKSGVAASTASKRMPSAEDVRSNSRYTRSIETAVPQLSMSMPHLPSSCAETFRPTGDKKGATTSIVLSESVPFSAVEIAASGGGVVTAFESGQQQASLPQTAAPSGIAEFRQRLARRLSRSSRLSRRRSSGNSSSSLSSSMHKRRSGVAGTLAVPSVDAATATIANGSKRALLAVPDSFSAGTGAAASLDPDCEATLTRGMNLLHMREAGGRLDTPQPAIGEIGAGESGDSSGSRLLSESIDCLLERRLFGPTACHQVTAEAGSAVPKLQPLSASSSMSSLATFASSSMTLSGEESLQASLPAAAQKLQDVLSGSGISGESASESEIVDYEDFMYLSACESHRHRLLCPAATEKDTAGRSLDYDGRKWWPRCVLPVHNMQYMPKLSLMFAGEPPHGARLMSDRHHSSESIPLQWLQPPSSPRLLRARSEGAIGKVVASAGSIGDDSLLDYCGTAGGRRMDFWDVLGRCPMRPTSSLALASLKDMAKSRADACGYVGGNRKSDSENRSNVYLAGSLADSASDSDDSDSDSESPPPVHGALLGLSPAKQQASAMQRSNGATHQQRGSSNRSKAKRVLSEPMQYILYNSYLRYYGRPGEAQ